MHITTIRPQQHRLDRKLLVSVADRSMTWRRAVEDSEWQSFLTQSTYSLPAGDLRFRARKDVLSQSSRH